MLPLFGHHVPDEDDGSPEASSAKEASPINYVSEGDPPTLLVHGTEDDIIDIQSSEIFRDALQEAGVPVKLVPVEGAGHGPHYPDAQIDLSEIQAEYVAWFDEHLRQV